MSKSAKPKQVTDPVTEFYNRVFISLVLNRYHDGVSEPLIQPTRVAKFFMTSNLNKTILRSIYNAASQSKAGGLTLTQFINAMKLIAIAQRFIERDPSIANNLKISLSHIQKFPQYATTLAMLDYPPDLQVLAKELSPQKRDTALAVTTENATLKEAITQWKELLESKEDELDLQSIEIETLRAENLKLSSIGDASASKSDLSFENEKLKEAISQWRALLKSKDDELDLLSIEIESFTTENKRLQQSQSNLLSENKRLKEAITQYKRKGLQKLETERRDNKIRNDALQSKLYQMEAANRQLNMRYDTLETEMKRSEIEKNVAKSGDKIDKPFPAKLMKWFLDSYAQMPTYYDSFVTNNADDIRCVLSLNVEALQSHFDVKQWHISAFLRCIQNLKKDNESLQSFMNQCKAVDLTDLATMADNNGIYGWEALSFLAVDEQSLADIFRTKPNAETIVFLWQHLKTFKEYHQRPKIQCDANSVTAKSELEGKPETHYF